MACVLLIPAAGASQPKPGPVRVFVLAGQSNMEGQAVADLEGSDYNEGKGTLLWLLRDPDRAPLAQHLRDALGQWTVRPDVWVRYRREEGPLLRGPLTMGFSVYGDAHHLGPELEFGHRLGNRLTNQVLLVKTAWGGKSLYRDFRPPSSGGAVGPYYTRILAEVREALANLKADFPEYDGGGFELTGLVWYQGWNDGCEPQTAVPQYETNLVNLIRDVRRDLGAPTLPVVIGELTGPWVNAPGEWGALRRAQAAAASRPEFKGNVVFVPSHDFVRAPEMSPNPGHGHHEFGNAETYLRVGGALGEAMLGLLSPHGSAAAVAGTAADPSPNPSPKAEGVGAVTAHSEGLHGYIGFGHEPLPSKSAYTAGMGFYAAVWPLADQPLADFQIGLPSTWILPDNSDNKDRPLAPQGTLARQWRERGPTWDSLFQTVEGGLGYWAGNHFRDGPPKFSMNATPQYYRHAGDERLAVAASEVPMETRLHSRQFKLAEPGRPYTSPTTGAWTQPGPKAGPFTVRLVDGSIATYSWYRFVDQPSFQQYHWSESKKAKLQALVERIHATWPIDRDYMAPPVRGTLATLDPALLVTPLQGLEAGYVPITTRQARE